MPRISIDESVPATSSLDLFRNSQYRYLPWPARIRLMLTTTATGVNMQVTSGSEMLQPSTPIDAGGTIHKLPTVFTVDPLDFIAPPGDLLQIVAQNTTTGALNVMGIVDVNPA